MKESFGVLGIGCLSVVVVVSIRFGGGSWGGIRMCAAERKRVQKEMSDTFLRALVGPKAANLWVVRTGRRDGVSAYKHRTVRISADSFAAKGGWPINEARIICVKLAAETGAAVIDDPELFALMLAENGKIGKPIPRDSFTRAAQVAVCAPGPLLRLYPGGPGLSSAREPWWFAARCERSMQKACTGATMLAHDRMHKNTAGEAEATGHRRKKRMSYKELSRRSRPGSENRGALPRLQSPNSSARRTRAAAIAIDPAIPS